MQKKSNKPGKNTSKTIINAEIQGISRQGLWLFINDQEFFLPFTKFPWFLKATIDQIYNLQLIHNTHLHWPDIDVDLDLDILQNPEAYPLQYT